MPNGVFNTTDPDYTHYNGEQVTIIASGQGFHDVVFPDGTVVAASVREVKLLPEEPRLSNKDIIDVIGDLISRVYEPYSGSESYEEQWAANVRAVSRAQAAQAELARREENC
jgi:hypothetical protein